MSHPTADAEKADPFAAFDGRKASVISTHVVVSSLRDADEALTFLENHPRRAEIAEEGAAILDDPVQLKKLVRKIDMTIAPLLAAVYFLQFLDKTTLSYTAVMGIRKETHLVGQEYSDLSMLFYVGEGNPIFREHGYVGRRDGRGPAECCADDHCCVLQVFW